MFPQLLQALGLGRMPGEVAPGEVPARILQHAGHTDVCGTFTPEDDGPICIEVGARASAERLRRPARHHLEPESLLIFARRH